MQNIEFVGDSLPVIKQDVKKMIRRLNSVRCRSCDVNAVKLAIEHIEKAQEELNITISKVGK